ncbi:TlpA disulfide reductase family protein [Cytophagaceae bacterium YF14B1]|uniref:TlpA disulfide reductase family protein n=1 Tax=Xanthocytophaga flava TaxID=3048013 RepID=A0AAE3U5E7_9BACT|nr:TlpA disulfide reductase family protein [Xanthocytophaga flavus]MDJ1480704.1 TlpA disulfide reductase family protein [Xanthocytophaga flavus]
MHLSGIPATYLLRNYSIYLFYFFITQSCLSQQDTSFTIYGTIDNSPLQKVYLYRYDKRAIKVDSALIDNTSDTFILKGIASEELHYKIIFEKEGGSINLALKNEDIKIYYRINRHHSSYPRRDLSISNNPSTITLLEWEYTYANYQDSVYQLKQIIDSLKINNLDQKKIQIQEDKLLSTRINMFDYSSSIVRNTSSPVCAELCLIDCIVLMKLFPEISKSEEIENLVEFVKNKFPNTRPIQLALLSYKPLPHKTKEKIKTSFINQNSVLINLPDTVGKLTTSSFKNKYVLLDFWASWCLPCRQQNPHLISIYTKFKNKGFTIYSISIDENKEPWLQAIKQDKINIWTHVIDTRVWKSPYLNSYNITYIPYNFLIDPRGTIIAQDVSEKELDEILDKVLK